MNKLIAIVIATAAVVGGGAFYGGMKYQQSKNSMSGFSRQNFQNLSQEQRQQLQANAGTAFQGGNRAAGQGFLTGEVLSKDAQSLTLKMQDGGSKIVFLSSSTTVSRTTEGSISDIEIGKQIMVAGKQNSDGSYVAQTIQER
ncbi:MAG: DUF5666 domain-containing protein [Candidatus Nealsonbacteria bacterium]|nr:DUF5666 domain-containing protein [Candidatus Nealsonbacteria bacterium]